MERTAVNSLLTGELRNISDRARSLLQFGQFLLKHLWRSHHKSSVCICANGNTRKPQRHDMIGNTNV